MTKRLMLVLVSMIAADQTPRARADVATLANQVRDAERAFAKTMVDRR